MHAHPDVTPHPSVVHAQELSLALRRLSDKLDFTEASLLQRNKELTVVHGERDIAKHAAENAFAIAARLRGEVEAAREKERTWVARVKAAEEECRISDLAVEEYADLVRIMEGRRSSIEGVRKSVDGLTSARVGLQRLLEESNVETEKLQAEIARLHTSLERAHASLEGERQASLGDKTKIAELELELQRLRADDNAAAKMVSRYM